MFEKLMSNPAIATQVQKFEALPPRDRLALKALSVVVGLLILYGALWVPAASYKLEGMQILEGRQDLLALVQENKKTLRRLSGQGQKRTVQLDSQQLVSSVTNMAKRGGLNLKRFEPSGENQVKVWVDNAPFDKLVSWLANMNKSISVYVEQISLEKEDEIGLVSARITLSS